MKSYDFNSFAEQFLSQWLAEKNIPFQTTVDDSKPGVVTFTVSQEDSTSIDVLLSYKLSYKPEPHS